MQCLRSVIDVDWSYFYQRPLIALTPILKMHFLRTIVILYCIHTLSTVAFADDTSKTREWKAKTGTFSVEAEYLESDATHVKLKRLDNGKTVSVEISKLSESDQKFIQSMKKKAEVPPKGEEEGEEKSPPKKSPQPPASKVVLKDLNNGRLEVVPTGIFLPMMSERVEWAVEKSNPPTLVYDFTQAEEIKEQNWEKLSLTVQVLPLANAKKLQAMTNARTKELEKKFKSYSPTSNRLTLDPTDRQLKDTSLIGVACSGARKEAVYFCYMECNRKTLLIEIHGHADIESFAPAMYELSQTLTSAIYQAQSLAR